MIEMLVVIAIIIILVALLMGGLYKAQESSNRIACMNNMRQLGAAFYNYQLTNKEFPTEARNNQSFYKSLLTYVEQQYADDSTQVSVYLCPSRRGKDAGAKRDYGYANSSSADSPSILDSDPDATSAAPQGATMEMVNASNGSEHTAMLTHVWMSPSTYAGGDSTDLGWATKNNGRSNNTTTAWDKGNGDASMLGGPHPSTNPTLFVDGHVVSIPYADASWVDRWAYMAQDSSFAGGTGRWVRVWNDGNSGGSGGGGSSGGPAETNSANSLGPVSTTTNPGTSTTTTLPTQNPGTAPNTSTRTDVNNSPSQQPTNSGDRDQQYQDTVDEQKAKEQGQAAQAERDAQKSAAQAAEEANRSQTIVTTIVGQGDGPGRILIIVQTAADKARQEANNASQAKSNGDVAGAQAAAKNAASAASTATNGRKQLEGMVPSSTPVVTTTPVTTQTPTQSPSTSTSTTTTGPTSSSTSTAPSSPSSSSGSGSSGSGSSGSGGSGYYEWVFIPW
jgi:type II secretory pathway pseudopilin PulG